MKTLNHALVAAARGAAGSRIRLTNGLWARHRSTTSPDDPIILIRPGRPRRRPWRTDW